jgi:histidine phosphotransferase ChpT
MTDDSDLSALLAARLCHDLISPIGAISNGLELLSLASSHDNAELAFITQTVASATTRLRFARIAFGPAEPGQSIAMAEVREILAQMSQGGRLRHDWTLAPEMSREDVKRAFLMTLCLQTAMPFGGSITCRKTATGHEICGETPRLAVDHALWQRLQPEGSEFAPSAELIHFTLLGRMLRQGRGAWLIDFANTCLCFKS